MHLNQQQILAADRKFRLNLINSLTGIKPANLIGTTSPEHGTNLAIFSSVVHLGATPPLYGFIMRPLDVMRNTYANIKETGVYTINHVPLDKAQSAHQTSGKYPEDISEFDECGFTESYIDGFTAPFVEESPIKLGLRFVDELSIKQNDTHLIIGEIEHVLCSDEYVDARGYVDFEQADIAGIGGLNRYYRLSLENEYPYVRLSK